MMNHLGKSWVMIDLLWLRYGTKLSIRFWGMHLRLLVGDILNDCIYVRNLECH